VELSISCGATVRALAMALELRDDATGEHAQRVTALAVDIAEHIAPDLITDPQLEYGYLLHDVGKIGIPDAILLKPGHLTAAERRTMQEHTRLGGQIVSSVPQLDGLAREIVASHHERWDGKGYPLGLGGEGIPVAARIFAVADAFDAMTHDRPYRGALSVEDAVSEIRTQAGHQFDPEVADVFLGFAVGAA
jgi:HD-GYP domain-containing protein (c-di-GMP phosphodiesterase class II)